MKENLKLVLLCDPRNLGLLGALKAKPLANWHFPHWWHENIPNANLENNYPKSIWWLLLKIVHTTYIMGQEKLLPRSFWSLVVHLKEFWTPNNIKKW
jgi:hypothetical protein